MKLRRPNTLLSHRVHHPHNDLPSNMRSRLPIDVNVVRPLGHGRAAKAVLVEATLKSGRKIQCVEKIFAPGRLTRAIYRIGFQAPFAYQKNIHAVLTAFYRRRVAAAAIQASDVDADVAEPLYIRFDSDHQAWVLAARWIDGRGIRPAEAGMSSAMMEDPIEEPEITQILRTMRGLENVLSECGLIGSGWQVAPSAMVSTANLLRTGDRYTVIDLESGIPAVLVPKYLLAGLRRAYAPPFDDLDATALNHWLQENNRLLTFRLGTEAFEQLCRDTRQLTQHDQAWKSSEIAIARRPGKWLRRGSMRDYQSEYVRQLNQDNKLDQEEPSCLRLRAMWWAGCVPTRIGGFLQGLIGNSAIRKQCLLLLSDRGERRTRLNQWCETKHTRMVESGRLRAASRGQRSVLRHASIGLCVPSSLHRYLSDAAQRKQRRLQALLLVLSPTYQAWFGEQRIVRSIDKWREEQRIDELQAEALKGELSGDLVRAYVRGFGLHVALKGLAPIWVPIKLAGTAAFIATGNMMYLLPFLITPLLRLAVTVQSWRKHHRTNDQTRHIPHREAMWLGCLPVVGLVAFPMQMFFARPQLSTFLIRDVAAKIGRRIPIYGGKDSRTEIACIKIADRLIAVLNRFDRAVKRLTGSQQVESIGEPIETRRPETLLMPSRWARRISRLANREVDRQTAAVQTAPPAQHRRAA